MATKFRNRPSSSTPTAFPKFRCSWPNCSFTAKRLALLKNHVRNHNQEKPFKCHYCSYSSESRSNCKVHEQRMHTLQRPHKCHYCTYSCVQSTTLRQHIQIKHRDRCQYRCFQCRNFHCQRESQLMYHLLKVHQKTTVAEISPYLNPNYLPDYLPSMGEMNPKPADDGRMAVGNSTVPQRPSQAKLRQNRRYSSAPQKAVLQINPTPCKLLRAPANSFSSSSAVVPTVSPRMSQSFHVQEATKSNVPSASMWATGRRSSAGAQYRRQQQTTRQASLNDLSEHSLLASSSLIAPLDDGPEVIEIIENEDEGGVTAQQEMQSSSGIYVCNHCLSTFPDEDSLLSHVLSVHPDTTTLQHCETAEESPHQQDVTHQDSITSSSSFVFFPANQSSAMEMSPTPVSISQDDFVVPPVVKQEDGASSQVGQEIWSSVDDKVASDAGMHRRERHSSETLPESAFVNVQIQRSASRSSHDSNFSQPVSAREGTPLLSMPSPTTTHSNRVTVSTQTVPSSTERGGANVNQTKYCCVHCNIIFPDNVLFTIHRGAHGFHSPFECNFCGKDCANKHEFASHLQNCS
ncbi:zinc finger protein Pegasus-like [Patiria miniata]|uniref:C2H2-type domain-containing protein n=1 Tax=Patiria miniata TaxID=46514 RepID=A0A914BS53_PATMI|nr:zinc finger protein Pegasus-like [Patiria miniata]